MHIFLDNFHQGGKCTAHIESQKEFLEIEEIFTDQNYLSLSSIHNDYLNLDSSSYRNNERANIVQVKGTFLEVPTQQREKRKGQDK